MDKIIDHLYLGDWLDGIKAAQEGIYTICVIETPREERYEGMGYYCPILQHSTDEEGTIAFVPPRVSIEKLNEFSDILEERVTFGCDTLVHCYAGIERSPLAIVYWLNTRRGLGWDNAYKFVKEKRNVIEDRSSWM